MRVVTGAIVCALCLVVAAASFAGIKGPKTVAPEQRVTFRITGFKGKTTLNATIQEESFVGSNSGGVIAKKRFDTDAQGTATLRFRFPTEYFVCGGVNDCTPIPWQDGDRAVLFVCDLKGTGGCASRKLTIEG